MFSLNNQTAVNIAINIMQIIVHYRVIYNDRQVYICFKNRRQGSKGEAESYLLTNENAKPAVTQRHG